MANFKLSNLISETININFNNHVTFKYNTVSKVLYIHAKERSFYGLGKIRNFKITKEQILDESTNTSYTHNYFIQHILCINSSKPDMKIIMQLYKLLRFINFEWRKQYNDNIDFFTRGFVSNISLIRCFLLLIKCPALILSIPELRTDLILKSSSDLIKIENYNGTNLQQIFGKNRNILKIFKGQERIKSYKLKKLSEFKNDYNWEYDKSLKILEFFVSSDFSNYYNNGAYIRSYKYTILDVLSKNYSYDKVYNFFNKYMSTGCEYDKGLETNNYLYGLIVDTWTMLEDLKLIDLNSKHPIIYPENAIKFHDIVTNYYNIVMHTNKTTKGFLANVNKSAEYMDLEVEDYVFIVLKSPSDLTQEGYSLSHCVGSYYSKVDSGSSVIVSMRKKDKIGTPIITIEAHTVSNSIKIYQSRGKHNRSPTKSENDTINKWKIAAENKLEILKKLKIEKANDASKISMNSVLKLLNQK